MRGAETLIVLAEGAPALSVTVESTPEAPIPEGIRTTASYVGDNPPPELLGTLDETERLFIAGWIERQKVEGKPRPREGLSWDAPGMLPPDLPGGQ